MRVRLLVLFVIALVLSGCQVDAVVDVDVNDDGSGTVTITTAFDEAFVEAVPEIEDGLRTADLAEAGWTGASIELRGTPRLSDGPSWA